MLSFKEFRAIVSHICHDKDAALYLLQQKIGDELNIIWNYGFTALCMELQLNSCNAVNESISKGYTKMKIKHIALSYNLTFIKVYRVGIKSVLLYIKGNDCMWRKSSTARFSVFSILGYCTPDKTKFAQVYFMSCLCRFYWALKCQLLLILPTI